MVILGTIWSFLWVLLFVWQVVVTTDLKRWTKKRDERINEQLNSINNIYTEIRDALKKISKK